MTIRTLSHSSIQDFLLCQRRFEWRRVRRLRRTRKQDALRQGDLYHQGLDLLKKGKPLEDVLVKIWSWYNDNEPRYVSEEAWLIEREVCLRLLVAWATLTEPLKVVAAELRFEAKIKNPKTGRATGRFRYLGILDGVVELEGRGLAVLEHKTTRSPIEPHSDYIRRLRVDSQISRYLLTAREAGIDVSTVVYDITRKPSIRPRKLTKKEAQQLLSDGAYFGQTMVQVPACPERETPEMFGARLNHDILKDPGRYFYRLEVPRLQAELEEEARELWLQQKDIARAVRTGHFSRNTAVCLSPYRCEYTDLCLYGTNPGNLLPGEVPDGYQSTQGEKK